MEGEGKTKTRDTNTGMHKHILSHVLVQVSMRFPKRRELNQDKAWP